MIAELKRILHIGLVDQNNYLENTKKQNTDPNLTKQSTKEKAILDR